jgi:hypothetical protein
MPALEKKPTEDKKTKKELQRNQTLSQNKKQKKSLQMATIANATP